MAATWNELSSSDNAELECDHPLSSASTASTTSIHDPTDIQLLRSRIEDQSHLIMILKRRFDEGIVRIQTLETLNKELEAFRESAEKIMHNEIEKNKLLNRRFDDLASNHEEMIRIKDEYKMKNEELRKENEKLLQDNNNLFSADIQQRDHVIEEMKEQMENMKLNHAEQIEMIKRVAEQRRVSGDETNSRLKDMERAHQQEIDQLQLLLKDNQSRTKALEEKMDVEMKLKAEKQEEFERKMNQAMEERNQLEKSAKEREKRIDLLENSEKRLHSKVTDLQQKWSALDEKYRKEAEELDSNTQVKKLKERLAESQQKQDTLERKFDAFKKHSVELLDKERAMNERLRHLTGANS